MKKINKQLNLILLLFILITSFSCSSTNETLINSENLNQFTPEQADWSTFTHKMAIYTQDIYGWKYSSSDPIWENAKWDGSIYDPTKMSKDDFTKAICPGVPKNGQNTIDEDMIRGLRELYLEHKPFKDVNNPTKAEVDEWHSILINHIRKLTGYNKETEKIKKDSCRFLGALWADQRKFTTMWDVKYTNKTCVGSSSMHCGFGFTPNSTDQLPYLAPGAKTCSSIGAGRITEGVLVRARSHIPWTYKMIRPFCESLKLEGYWGGHVAPFFRREKFGFSFWDNDKEDLLNTRSYTILRANWGGGTTPEKYVKVP